MTFRSRPRPSRRWWPLPIALSAAIVVMMGCAAAVKTTYTGTYIRTWIDEYGGTQQVQGPVRLILDDRGNYRIEGEARDLPPAGAGLVTRDHDRLILTDTSSAVAGFDLSLILRGPFRVAEEGDGLVLLQENQWGYTHLLMLDREDE